MGTEEHGPADADLNEWAAEQRRNCERRLEAVTLQYEQLADELADASKALSDRSAFRNAKIAELEELGKRRVPKAKRKEHSDAKAVARYEISIEDKALESLDERKSLLEQQVSNARDLVASVEDELKVFVDGPGSSSSSKSSRSGKQVGRASAIMSGQNMDTQSVFVWLAKQTLVGGGIISVFAAVYFIGSSLGTLSTKSEQAASELVSLKGDLTSEIKDLTTKIEDSSNALKETLEGKFDSYSESIDSQVALIRDQGTKTADRIESSLIEQMKLSSKVADANIATTSAQVTSINSAISKSDERLDKLETHARMMSKRTEGMSKQLTEVLTGLSAIQATLESQRVGKASDLADAEAEFTASSNNKGSVR